LYLCYIDESGTSSIPGNTSHFVLAGLSVPIWHWRDCDREVSKIKNNYSLQDAELHTAWILRKYIEQNKIPNFSSLNHNERVRLVTQYRNAELLRIQRTNNRKLYQQTKKNYAKTNDYIHLTHDERKKFIEEIATCVANWGFARIFAECIDKIHYNPTSGTENLDKQAFEQVVTRFEHYLNNISEPNSKCFGLIIHDNNETVAKKHTQLMKSFHRQGTLWTDIGHIIETPLFVNSELTSLVQIADLCSYSIRRYLENNEERLFALIFKRADRKSNKVVGVRHFTTTSCPCDICKGHR